jgi:hypothetical protein
MIEEIQDLEKETKQEEVELTLRKASAISKIASQIVSNGNLVLRAKELEVTMLGKKNTKLPKMLEG